MLTPNQINAHAFPPAGRGTYKSSDVDVFFKRVSTSYEALYNSYESLRKENSDVKSRFFEMKSLVDEYIKNKDIIAKTMVMAQSVADKTKAEAQVEYDRIVAESKEKAQAVYDEIVNEAKAKAQEIIEETSKQQAEKTAQANDYLNRAVSEYERKINEVNAQADEIVRKTNSDIERRISDANERISEIFERAEAERREYIEALSRDINITVNEYNKLRSAIEYFKTSSLQLLTSIIPSLESISLDEEFNLEALKIDEISGDDLLIKAAKEFVYEDKSVSNEAVAAEDEGIEVEADVFVNAVEEPAVPEREPFIDDTTVYEPSQSNEPVTNDEPPEYSSDFQSAPGSELSDDAASFIRDFFSNMNSSFSSDAKFEDIESHSAQDKKDGARFDSFGPIADTTDDFFDESDE